MAPSGPSLTSQARAAELSAATAARARTMNGELSDISELPSSQPISLADFTTSAHARRPKDGKFRRIVKVENTEGFKRPNRPVERYYPPVVHPVPTHPYPPPQYIDQQVPYYGPAPYPAYPPHPPPPPPPPVRPPPDYYYPAYQGMPSYYSMYPSHPNNYPAAGAIPVPGAPISGPPVGPPTAMPPVAPPIAPPRAPSIAPPAKLQIVTAVTDKKDATPAKDPLSTPSPRKPVKDDVQDFFRLDDLTPTKWEEDVMYFKAAALVEQENLNKDSKEDRLEPPQAKTAEADETSDRQNKDIKFDSSSGLATPITKPSETSSPSTNPQAPSHPAKQINGTRKTELKYSSPLKTPQKSPQKLHSPEYASLAESQSLQLKLLSSGVTSQNDTVAEIKGDVSMAERQLVLDMRELQSVEMFQENAPWLSLLFSLQDEPHVPEHDTSGQRKLHSPFQRHAHSPVQYFQPIVNKYTKNIFESDYTLWQALRNIDNDSTWKEFQRNPKVEGLPGPFIGFEKSPLVEENALPVGQNGEVRPPPGLETAYSMPPPGITPWNSKAGNSIYSGSYYERILRADDWFRQGVSEKDGYATKFQKKLDEERAMLYIANGESHDLTTPAMATQTTDVFRRIMTNLSSYLDDNENKKKYFGFGDYSRSHYRRRKSISTIAADFVMDSGPGDAE